MSTSPGRRPFRSNVLITGASSGLGAEMARQLAAKGHDLALCARRFEALESLREEILAVHPGRRVEVRTLDVTDDDAVAEVFAAFRADLGTLDRVVVNAGRGKGAPLGTGDHAANRQTAMTNFVAGLAQIDAAMAAFRDQSHGHLVVVSSMAAVRGLPGAATTYAATKAGLAHLAEGLRAELHGTDIAVTVLYPGFIVSEMNDASQGASNPLLVSTEKGVRAMVSAMEKEKGSAMVPPIPWVPLGVVLRHAPIPLLRRMT